MKFIDNFINKIAIKVKEEMTLDIQLLSKRIDALETELSINNKINGLLAYVEDKTSGIGKSKDIEILKRLTKLEGEKVDASS